MSDAGEPREETDRAGPAGGGYWTPGRWVLRQGPRGARAGTCHRTLVPTHRKGSRKERRGTQRWNAQGQGGCRQGRPRQGFRGNCKREWPEGTKRRKKTTPELPDQVIAVTCQSAAERGSGGRERGREKEEGHAPSEQDGTERTSVKNKPPQPDLPLQP